MRLLHVDDISLAVAELCCRAAVCLPEDMRHALKRAEAAEESPVGRSVLRSLLENADIALAEGLPLCQDTGMAVVFADIGVEVLLEGGTLEQAVNRGVTRGYKKGWLRKSVVAHPLERRNTGDNTPAVLHLRQIEGDRLRLTVAPKGFGSENMTRLFMLNPTAGEEAVVETAVRAVDEAGANPCPPVVVGIGLGGTAELALEISKRALLRPLATPAASVVAGNLEKRILERINNLGIGPAGLGGRITALAVHLEEYPTHIAGLPMAVSISCHALRHAEAVL